MSALTRITLARAGLALAGDGWSHAKAAATGKTHEANPVQAWLQRTFGDAPATIATHVLAFAVLAWLGQWPVNLLIAAVFGFVTWRNLHLKAIRK